MRALSILARNEIKRLRKEGALLCSLADAWLVSDFEHVFQKVDEVTKNTSRIGMSFVNDASNELPEIQSFHWLAEVPDQGNGSLLNIELHLVPSDGSYGNIALVQQILRLGEDEFAYWGVD
jgi:hypothetical protein